MELKNTFSIVLSKFGMVYRIIIYVIICLLVVTAIGSCFIVPLNKIFNTNEGILEHLALIKDTVLEFSDGNLTINEFVSDIKDVILSFYNYLKVDTNVFALTIVMVIVVSVVYRFFIALSYVAITDIFSEFMLSNMRYGFVSNFIKNFKKGVSYAAGYTLVTVPIDVIIVFACFGVFLLTFNIFSILATTITVIVALVVIALRLTFFSAVLPVIVSEDEDNFFKALKKSMSIVKINIHAYSRSIGVLLLLYYGVTSVSLIPTFGILNIVMTAFLALSVRVLELCYYYRVKRTRYYVDFNTVVDPSPFIERKDLETDVSDENR